MKLIRATKDNLLFELSKREKRFLLHVLNLYARVPSTRYRLSKSGNLPDAEASQRLLDESLAEQRANNRKTLQAFLTDPAHFSDTKSGSHFSVSRSELGWLLQVLNDVRVGSWIILGSPEQEEKAKLLNE